MSKLAGQEASLDHVREAGQEQPATRGEPNQARLKGETA